jgi:hypothetical protein
MTQAWVLTHLAVTWAMVGVMWMVQLLQYPLMAVVPAEGFPAFERAHQRRIVVVLALFAPVEIVTAAAIAFTVDGVPGWLSFGAGVVLAVSWAATGAFYAPLHGRLADGFDATLHRRLVATNWWRTAAWTARGGAAIAMTAIAL